MGTSTMGSDLHSDKQDKLLKLQARKKELEQMLASKNEELYKLCVQEVQLTGIMPPEAPLSPDVPPRERLGSVRSADRPADGADVQDGADSTARRIRTAPLHDHEPGSRKNLCHRLSTPSISGVSAQQRPLRRPDTSCSNFFPSPPQERGADTFSIHTSHTYPALAGRLEPPPPEYRHQALVEYSNRTYCNSPGEGHSASRLRETHFSSSHPDIAHYIHGTAPPVAPAPARHTPLLYQYASHLKSQNQHLGALNHHHQMQMHSKRRTDGVRRNTLQRTQTYHLTSHSDYSQHLDNMLPHYQHRSQPDIQEQPAERRHAAFDRNVPVPNTLPLRERPSRLPLHLQLQVSTDDYVPDERSPLSPLSHMSGYSQSNFDSVSMNKFSPLSQLDGKVKEKQWYETSLDSPSRNEGTTLRKSASLKRTPSIGNSQTYEIMISSGRHSALQSPGAAHSPPVMSPGAVSLESPKNMTVIEQGKCIPYREETKPFEMSDFYKYSTKFRQANAPKPAAALPTHHPNAIYNKMPVEVPQFNPDQWHGYTN